MTSDWECDNRSDNWQVDEKTKQLTHRQLTHILSKRKSNLYSESEFPGVNQRHPNILETKRLCMPMSRARRDGERFFLQGTTCSYNFPRENKFNWTRTCSFFSRHSSHRDHVWETWIFDLLYFHLFGWGSSCECCDSDFKLIIWYFMYYLLSLTSVNFANIT